MLVLARAGLLDGLSVTTHWADIEELRGGYPALDVVQNVPAPNRPPTTTKL